MTSSRAGKTFSEWLHEEGRNEALQDVYFEEQMGPGSEFTEWAESVFKAMQSAPGPNERRQRSWPFTQ